MTECVGFSRSSLRQFLGHCDKWVALGEIPADGSWGLLGTRQDGYLFILDKAAAESDPVVLIVPGSRSFGRLVGGLREPLSRLHRVASQGAQLSLRLPTSWRPFQDENRIMFFAYHFWTGVNARFVAELVHRKAKVIDIIATVVTDDDAPADVRAFRFDDRVYGEAIHRLPEAVRAVREGFARQTVPTPETPGILDLDETVGSGVIVGSRTYSSWLPYLTDSQRDFVLREPTRSLKLRGPAGTGKTLAMVLKVLHELHRSRDVKILFPTHSWALADQVSAALRRLDDEGLGSEATVFPLLQLAEDQVKPKAKILGEDSFSGKREQLKLIGAVLEQCVRSNWLAYRAGCSSQFQRRVESKPGSPGLGALVWDLMLEFGCVIGANGIMPGLGAKDAYLKIERRPWMMPLASRRELEFVFVVYQRYIDELLTRNVITNDQVINDYLNYLRGYVWYSARQDQGYDLIFVDELHLFNQQERMVFHRLTRNPKQLPILFMALDPRQSPAETYADFPLDRNVTWGEGLTTESVFGAVDKPVDLQVVFRFTEQILELLRHLDKAYPALELGEDWRVTVREVSAAAGQGEIPSLVMHGSADAEALGAIRDAQELANRGSTALLCLSLESFQQYKDVIGKSSQLEGRFRRVESRRDVSTTLGATLRHAKKTVVLSQPHFVAGLQFDHVVLGGCRAGFMEFSPNQDHSLRRFLSDMYLGISRARRVVHIHASGGGGNLPNVIEMGLQAGVLSFQEC